MLQQTTVAAVKSRFIRFAALWPDVGALAAAPLEDILREWAGLGYYARARNLHASARIIAAEFGGAFPADEALLLRLPGIGAYTAAAIASIAFGLKAAAVDGNAERVVARVFAIDAPLPGAKAEIRALVSAAVPSARPGDFAQALMDLGATICTPRQPACGRCPLRRNCLAARQGNAELYPVKPPKRARPVRFGTAFVAAREDGHILVRTRPAKGLLGGMTEVPGTEWLGKRRRVIYCRDAPLAARWRKQPGSVAHVFTHFRLELEVFVARIPQSARAPEGCRWLSAAGIQTAGFPSLMLKVVKAAL